MTTTTNECPVCNDDVEVSLIGRLAAALQVRAASTFDELLAGVRALRVERDKAREVATAARALLEAGKPMLTWHPTLAEQSRYHDAADILRSLLDRTG